MERVGNKKQHRVGCGVKKEDISDTQYHWLKERRSVYAW